MSLLVSTLTAGTNNHPTSSEEANGPLTDFVITGVPGTITNSNGVAPMTGGFAINAQATPDNTVAIGTGICYVTVTPSGENSRTVRVRNTATINQAISANSSGSTQFDWIYVKVDPTNAATPNLAGDNVGSIYVSRNANNTTDSNPPAFGKLIGIVTVANGFSTLANSTIADKRVRARMNNGMIAVDRQLIGTVGATSWGNFTVTFPNGQSMPSSNYALVVTHAGEFSTGGQGSARLQLGVCTPLNSTQISVWVYNNYSSSLVAYISYLAVIPS